MSVEMLLLGLVGISLSLVVGYLLASNLKRSSAFRMENDYRNAQHALEEVLQKNGHLESNASNLTQQLQLTQIEVQRLTILAEAAKTARSESTTEMSSLNDKLMQEREMRHAAEKTNSTLQTQLDERNVTIEQLKTTAAELRDKCERERLQNEHQFNLNRDLSNRAMEFEVRAAESHNKYLSAEERLTEVRIEMDNLMSRHQALLAEQSELRTRLAERERQHSERLTMFEDQKRALSDQFRLLANDILDSKVRILHETNTANLGTLIGPFQHSMEQFKREVSDIHFRQTTQQGELRRELETLKEMNIRFTKEAQELSLAVNGQKKMHGHWGELVLDSVLERSGLVRDRDFKRFVTMHHESGLRVPDVVVNLPEHRQIIIDAKLSLTAYTRYVNTNSEGDRQLALKDHVSALKNRINELSSREYHKVDGVKSPDVVILFVPIESAFVEAVKADPDLFSESVQLNVLVATPTTLLTCLNIVKQIWRFEEHSRSTAQLVRRSELLFDKVREFLQYFHDIKKSLTRASEAYDHAEMQLTQGNANVISQLQDMKRLAPSIKQELPSYFTDTADPASQQLSDSMPNGSTPKKSRDAA
ncbi:MAG: DNA recombination protein RmuC [Deltaproteobacteria bacterium]|nr:DNA recombination protein RmuC [Deltaproteobacteria bacterium]